MVVIKKITLEYIEKKYKITDYTKLYEKVISLIEDNKIKIIKASGINGKSPALYNRYMLIEEEKDYSEYYNELQYRILPALDISYYKRNISRYLEDRENIHKLNNFLRDNSELLQIRISQKERSFQIWNKEKYLQNEGKTLLKRLGYNIENLNFYDTNEPLAYYSKSQITPMNILIVENMDTFYTIRKELMNNKEILGCNIGAIIYGRGKGIIKAFKDFEIVVDKYVANKDNTILYFGDIDYEGIGIYQSLYKEIGDKYKLKPFISGYQKVIEKSKDVDLQPTKEKQNRNIGTEFLEEFHKEDREYIQRILQKDLYIPQEILNIGDL